MANGSIKHIVEQFDEILSDDKNLSTRTGLRLSMTVLREAVTIVADIQEKFISIDKRVGDIERDRASELADRKKKSEDEQCIRRTLFGAAMVTIAMLLLNGLIFLFSTIPLITRIIEAAQP